MLKKSKPDIEKKPQNIKEYINWIENKFNVKIAGQTKAHYNAAALKVKEEFVTSKLWNNIFNEFKNISEEYELSTHSSLLALPSEEIQFSIKEFDSFLLKTFRRNVLTNSLWPKEPKDGWITPDNWFSNINDIVRTSIIVKYLDGVEFLLNNLFELANKEGAKTKKYYVGGVDGYYAAHIYVTIEYELPTMDFNTQNKLVSVEIQITTQIQEVIKNLLHKHFEIRRIKKPSKPEEWQWDYQCEEFATNYLGHMLHYIDGMIIGLKDHKGRIS
jgi:ppGpp synthetase/RelA/SpoT-type nucleotidyltranferase